MSTDQTYKTQIDQKADQIKAILFLLQTNLEEFKTEVNRAYELLKIGEKSNLSKKIEHMMDDPISNIFQISSDVDNQAKIIIDRIVKSFINYKSDLIQYAIRSKTYFNDLHYSIVLKVDNVENRNQIFDFYDKYDMLEISNRFPVYFQFVPIELIKNIPLAEEILTK